MSQLTAAAPPDTTTARTRTHEPRGGPSWARIFVSGLVLWSAAVLVTFATQNANLVPTIILLGSFLVPVTFVAYAFAHAGQVVTPQRIFTAFVYGGALGVLGASLLEAEFLRQPSMSTYVGVGLIEEAVKLAALWLLARRLPRYTMRDGIVLGAAVGFGFAALESAGYAFNALFTSNGLSLINLVETEVLRGILAPVGHGLWTAILGGALFATAAGHGRPRLGRAVLGWYLLIAALHALWDASQPIAVWLTLLLTGTQVQWQLIRLGQVTAVTQAQVHLFTAISWGMLLLDGLLGLLILRGRWRHADGAASNEASGHGPCAPAGQGRGPGQLGRGDEPEQLAVGDDGGDAAAAGQPAQQVGDRPVGRDHEQGRHGDGDVAGADDVATVGRHRLQRGHGDHTGRLTLEGAQGQRGHAPGLEVGAQERVDGEPGGGGHRGRSHDVAGPQPAEVVAQDRLVALLTGGGGQEPADQDGPQGPDPPSGEGAEQAVDDQHGADQPAGPGGGERGAHAVAVAAPQQPAQHPPAVEGGGRHQVEQGEGRVAEGQPRGHHHRHRQAADHVERDRGQAEADGQGQADGRADERDPQLVVGAGRLVLELGDPAQQPQGDAADAQAGPARDQGVAELVGQQRGQEQAGADGSGQPVGGRGEAGRLVGQQRPGQRPGDQQHDQQHAPAGTDRDSGDAAEAETCGHQQRLLCDSSPRTRIPPRGK
jgi:RsiW-degrading membrane proteinase PrsW (M82 family)